mmetsp:Transcript_11639/g.36087  ORF Transcript_11639/g.36087 Transcript_11639/m.36087 type:complete len:100 (-) Transcript_11639:1335-1634(-)
MLQHAMQLLMGLSRDVGLPCGRLVVCNKMLSPLFDCQKCAHTTLMGEAITHDDTSHPIAQATIGSHSTLRKGRSETRRAKRKQGSSPNVGTNVRRIQSS